MPAAAPVLLSLALVASTSPTASALGPAAAYRAGPPSAARCPPPWSPPGRCRPPRPLLAGRAS